MASTTTVHPNVAEGMTDRIMAGIAKLSPAKQELILIMTEVLCKCSAPERPPPPETSSQYGICDYCGDPLNQWSSIGLCLSCRGV